MNIDYKKLGLLILVAASAVTLAFMIYFLFFKSSSENINPGNGAPDSTSTLPISSNGGPNNSGTVGTNDGSFPNSSSTTTSSESTTDVPVDTNKTKTTSLTDSPVNFTASTGDKNGLIYYNNNDGKFYRISPTGQVSTFSDKVFHNVSNVVWSNSKNKAVLQYPDGSNIIYDFSQNKQYTVPKHWSDFNFSTNDTQIAFKSIAIDEENRYLAIGDTSGSNLKIIESLGDVADKFQVNWSPNNNMVANFVDSKDLDRSEIYFVGLNNENFKSMIVEGRGFEGLWNPDGNSMAYSIYNTSSLEPELWISGANADNIGANRNKLNLNTWADKCTFANKTELYCAVPQYIPYGAGMQRDLIDGTPDDIYKIDLQTGAKTMIANPAGNHEIDKVFPLPNSKYLLFTDANDGKIYRIEL